jgi:hypothetical protein
MRLSCTVCNVNDGDDDVVDRDDYRHRYHSGESGVDVDVRYSQAQLGSSYVLAMSGDNYLRNYTQTTEK